MRHPGAQDHLRYVRSPSLPGTELMVARGSSPPWHLFNERYALCVCRRGAVVMPCRAGGAPLGDERVLVWAPGEAHCIACIPGLARFEILYVETPLLAQTARRMGQPGALHFSQHSCSGDATLFRNFDQLCRSIEARDGPQEQQRRFEATVAALLRHACEQASGSALDRCRLGLERAKAFLRERCAENVRLEELAAVSGLSRFHLVHAFTREVGLPPHAYQIHVRIERAGSLLRQGIPAADVAAIMGFADQSHFARHFRQVMHITPGAYARCDAAARTF